MGFSGVSVRHGWPSMPLRVRSSRNESKLWSFLGFLSGIVGLVCFALSSSFKYLFGKWNFLSFLLYIAISLFICGLVLFAKKIKVSRSFMVKSYVGFLVLMLTSFYSFLYDKVVKGKPDALSAISYAAFAFMSLCFSRKFELGFEVGLFNFFLQCLIVQLMKINLILASVASVFCYFLIIFRCCSDSQQEIKALGIEDCHTIRIDSENGEMQVKEFPERPGEPECNYFMKTGDCKFKSKCKFHHPKNRVEKSPSIFNSIGLHLRPVEEFPERPGEPVCKYFLRTGKCRFKSSCKFHHPKNKPPSILNRIGLRLRPVEEFPERPGEPICQYFLRTGDCRFKSTCKFHHPKNH